MSDTEINTILDHAKNTDRLFYKYLGLLILTGMRPGDLNNQIFGKINLATNIMRISMSKTNTEIDFPLYSELNNFITTEYPSIEIYSPTELLFPTHKPHIVGRKFKKLKDLLNLNSKFDLKTFRKTFATRLIEGGMDGLFVSYLLGHKSTNITNKFYFKKNAKIIKLKLNENKFNFITTNQISANGMLTD